MRHFRKSVGPDRPEREQPPRPREGECPRPLIGRHPKTLGALSLMGLSGYELWIRIEDFWAWTSGLRHLSSVRGTSFFEDLSIVFQAPQMRQLGLKMLFLAIGCVFALVCLIRRRRPGGALMTLAVSAALAIWGVSLGLYGVSNWTQLIKLVPLGLIFVGGATTLSQNALRRRRGADPRDPRRHP